jgi:hypothetical protein
VIGCVGKDTPLDFFLGQIRSLRISEGERYSTDFTPDDALRPDEKAVLLYDASSVDGDRIIDLSGKNNHGTVE